MNLDRLPHKIAQVLGRNHVIVGCGGIGWWLATAAVMGGTRHITLIDPDVIEPSNRTRIDAPAAHDGTLKVTALAHKLRAMRGDDVTRSLCVVTYAERITDNHQLAILLEGLPVDVIWATTDTLSSRQIIYEYAKLHKVMYYYLGYDLDLVTISQENPDDGWSDDDGGYTVIPSSPIVAWAAALFGILAYVDGLSLECSLRLSRLLKGRGKMAGPRSQRYRRFFDERRV